MHTAADGLIPIVDGLLEKPVFIGSGFAAAQHPGMTLEWWPTSILAF